MVQVPHGHFINPDMFYHQEFVSVGDFPQYIPYSTTTNNGPPMSVPHVSHVTSHIPHCVSVVDSCVTYQETTTTELAAPAS